MRPTALPPLTRLHLLRTPAPNVHARSRPLHVIASHVLANAPTPHVFACHCEPVQKWEPGRTCAARRRRCSGVTETWLFSGNAGAKDTQLVSPRCGNPHPRRETWQAGNCSGKSVPPTNSPKVLLFPPPTARSTDCRVAPLLAMTCRAGFSQCKYALARQFPRFHGPCIRSPLLVHPTPNPGSGGKIRLTPFPRHFIIGKNDLPLWRKEF